MPGYHTAMAITEITRQAIFDELHLGKFWWAGRLDEPAFLNRLYRLSDLPSYDRRFKDVEGDIWQHRVNNHDWDDDWIFTDSRFELNRDDEKFLQFLAATVHPVVRPDYDEARQLVELYNRHLQADGWELAEVAQVSGRPVYAARSRTTVPGPVRQVAKVVKAGDLSYLANQITRMETAIENDPELAIGTAKELVETACKTVLEAMSIEVNKKWDLPQLLKETTKQLKVTPDSVRASAAGAESIRKVLGSLGSIVSGVAELRNSHGTGHGKSGGSGLGARHARLVVGAASTLTVFLFETYNDRTAIQ